MTGRFCRPLLRTKKQDYKFGLFDLGKGADGLKFDLCVCKPCTAQEDAKLPVVNGTSVVQELETEREDCQCPCKNRRGGVIKTHTFVFKKYFSLKSVCNCAPSPPL